MTNSEKIYKSFEKLGIISMIEKGIDNGKSESKGFMDLNFDSLYEYDDNKWRIALAHRYEQNGDLMADPDMEIDVDLTNKAANAVSFQQDSLGYYRTVESDTCINLKTQNELNSFLNDWMNNCIAQRHSFSS